MFICHPLIEPEGVAEWIQNQFIQIEADKETFSGLFKCSCFLTDCGAVRLLSISLILVL